MIGNYPACRLNSDNEQKACMMLNDWTIKWHMKLNDDAGKVIYTEKNNSNFAYT